MREPTIAAGLARGLIDLAAAKGVCPQALAARAGIGQGELGDQDNRIAMAKYIALMRAAQQMSGDPALALHYGETVDMSEVSIVGLIMNASETMLHAFSQLRRFGKLAMEVEKTGGKESLELVTEGGDVWLVDTRADPNDFPEQTESTFARLVCGPRRFLPRQHVLEVNVTHPAPAHRAEYDRVFQCPVVFEARWNALRMDMSLATHKVALQPRYVFGVLSAQAEALMQRLERSKSVRGRVESLLMPQLHTGDIAMDDVAAKMGVSRATLFRRLRVENTTFGNVLDDLRYHLALHYLKGKKTSVNQTAYLVGFSDPAAFSRAFKRWTGSSPRGAIGATVTSSGASRP